MPLGKSAKTENKFACNFSKSIQAKCGEIEKVPNKDVMKIARIARMERKVRYDMKNNPMPPVPDHL